MLFEMIAFLNKILTAVRGPTINSVSPAEAKALMEKGAIMLDVRTPAERSSMKIQGSKGVPLGELGKNLSSLPKDKAIVCQCASGMRSMQAAKMLAAEGFQVYNLKGGIMNWRSSGLSVKGVK